MAAPRDTSPHAFALQVELLRKAGPERRVAMAVEMSDAVLALARAHIRRRHPEFDDRQVRDALAQQLYGRT